MTIANRKSALLGLPFETPFSRKRGLKELELPAIPTGLYVYCRTDDRNTCSLFLTKAAGALATLARISESEKALLNVGEARVRISVDLDREPYRLREVYDAALAVVEAMQALELRYL
jgi:hypothetical protein